MKTFSLKNIVSMTMLIGSAISVVAFAIESPVLLSVGMGIFIVSLVIFAAIEH